MQGPYELIFDSQKAFLMDAKQKIKTFSNDWGLDFDDRANYYYLYVTGLLSHRCGLREVKIGIGKEIPDTIVDLGECNEKDPFAIPLDIKTSYKLSADIDFASIQIVFADGEKTEVKKVINYNYPPTR